MSKPKEEIKIKEKTNAKKEAPQYRFRAEDFWSLLQGQEYKCALTGRELTPENTEVELRDPYRTQGRGEYDNLYMVIRPLAYMARYVSEREIVDLAAEIIQARGGAFGYGLAKKRNTRRK